MDDLTTMPELTQSVFNFVKQEKKTMMTTNSVMVQGATVFENQSTLTGLKNDDFKIRIILKHSDLTEGDCIKLLKMDSCSLNDLLVFGAQLPVKKKLPKEFMIAQVLHIFLEERIKAVGDRLRDIKKNGVIS